MRLLRQGMYGRIEYGSVQEHALILYEADVLKREYLRAMFEYERFRETHKDEGQQIWKSLVNTYMPWDEEIYKSTIKTMEEELQELSDVKLGNYFKVDQRIVEETTDQLMEAMSKDIPYKK